MSDDLSRDRLSDNAIAEHLEDLEGWERSGDAIRRELKFTHFMRAIDFITRIAEHADDLDHHPEIHNVYTNVDLELSTHDADGLTEYDFELAGRINSEVRDQDMVRDEPAR
jgi:4a-hydroxytetrahydrobiopterin dehydratase